MKKHRLPKPAGRILTALLIAAALTGTAATGVLYAADNSLADAIYQTPRALDGNIIIIGIDAYSIDKLGPFNTWSRDYIADAIELLNSGGENRPAAIGVDILFSGYTDGETDAHLAAAAAEYGNVVTAVSGNFTSKLIVEGDEFYMDTYYVESVDKPFDELREGTVQGHINGMDDSDGVLRHSILYINDGDTYYDSFSYSIYKLYAREYGLPEELDVPTDARGNWYLSYSGEPGSYYDGFSLAGLLDGEYDPSMFAGCVVLIGAWAPGLSDYFITSSDRAENMYGVEYQANAIDALIRQDFKTEAGNLIQYTLLFVLIFAGVLFFYKRRVIFSTIAWLAAAGGWLGFSLLMYSAGYVLHPLWVPLMITAVYIGSVAVNYVRASLEKHRLKKTFERYVAPEVISELLKDPEAMELGGRTAEIAALFVDIRGFTTMSEALTPQEVVEILNQYLSLTTDSILKNHGTLDKFVGDCTMAIWNAPLRQEDYVMNACRAALAMVEGSRPLADKLIEKHGRSIGFGVGIHCGPAVVGNIGSSMRMDYTAIGDTVNTASRLESNAPAGTVYISRAVVDALEGRIKYTPIETPIKLKGKAEGFEIFTLDGLAEEAEDNREKPRELAAAVRS